jgi:hypothetical protein
MGSGSHANLPFHLYVNVKNSFLGPDMPEGVTPGIWHGVYSREAQVLMCHVLLESGANWSGLPLHALFTHDFSFSSEKLMPWGAMGTETVVWSSRYLHGLACSVHVPIEAYGRHTGLIIDWADGFSRYPQEHKPLNLVLLDAGQFALVPNNYVTFKDEHFVNPDARVNMKHYRRGETVYWEGAAHPQEKP